MRDPERPIDPPEGETTYCPVCGAENPEYAVESFVREPLGCEHCLTIKHLGVAQW